MKNDDEKISGLGRFLEYIAGGFAFICLCAGFIVFPSYLACYLWNCLADIILIPQINLFQGGLLWIILAISYHLMLKKCNIKFISIRTADTLSEEEISKIMETIQHLPRTEISIRRPANKIEICKIKKITNPADFNSKQSEENSSNETEKEKL